MESLENIVNLLAEEADRSRRALIALLERNREFVVPSASAAERIGKEFGLRSSVDRACYAFASSARWPDLTADQARHVHDRLVASLEFGRWLLESLPQTGEMDAEEWIRLLLIEHWDYVGRSRWRDIVQAKA